MREIVPGKKYKHFKGHIVEVLNICKDTDTLEEYVVYKHVDKSDIWLRSMKNFTSKVDKNKYPDCQQKYRFEEMEEVK